MSADHEPGFHRPPIPGQEGGGGRENDQRQQEVEAAQRYGHQYTALGERLFENLLHSEEPGVVRTSARELVLADIEDIWRDESAVSPNQWRLQNITSSIEARIALLRLGSYGEERLLTFGFDEEEIEQRMAPKLSSKKREELIEALMVAEDEHQELNRFHRLIANLLNPAVLANMDNEIGQMGHYRDVQVSVKMMEVIGKMESSIPGEQYFGDKVTIAMRALDEVAKGKVPGVPRVFAEEPNLGGRRMALGYMLRRVAGVEKTRRLWEESPLKQHQNPYEFAIQEALVQSIEDYSMGVTGKDLTDEERKLLWDEILQAGNQMTTGNLEAGEQQVYQSAVRKDEESLTEKEAEVLGKVLKPEEQKAFASAAQKDGRNLDKKEAAALEKVMKSGKLRGIPDIRNCRAAIKASPSLTDSYRACIVGWYLYRWKRKDVQHAVQPRPDDPKWKVNRDSLYRTLMGIPIGTILWHVENGSQAGDLVVLMWWIARSMEERLRREPGDRARWGGPDSLLGVVPNMAFPVDRGSFFRREGETEEGEIVRQTFSLEDLLFGGEKIEVTDEQGNIVRRPLYLRDVPWGQLYIESGQFFEKFAGVLEEAGIDWKPGVTDRDDFDLRTRLSRRYMLWFFKTFIKPEKGYVGTLVNLGLKSWQKKHAKKMELGWTLLLVANGIENSEIHRRFADFMWINACGAIIHETAPPEKGIGPDVRYTNEERFGVGDGPFAVARGGTAGEKQMETSINDVFTAAVDAGVFPSSDTEEGQRRLKLYAKMMTFVAENGRGLLPGEVPGFWSDDSAKESEIVQQIKDSWLYAPYRVVKRWEVRGNFRTYADKKVPLQMRRRIPGFSQM